MDLQNLAHKATENIKSTGSLKDFRMTHAHLLKDGIKLGEDYKFTNLNTFLSSLDLNGIKTEVDASHLQEEGIRTITFLNGKVIGEVNVPGVTLTSLEDGFESISPLIKSGNALTHLHHAYAGTGYIVSIDKNIQVKEPLRFLYINNESKVTAPTIIVKTGRFAEASIIEEFVGAHSSYLETTETYFELEEGAKLEHIQINKGEAEALHHGSTRATVKKDASYKNIIFHLSGKLSRSNLNIHLTEPGANGETYCLYLTNQSEHSDVSTVIHHEAADTTSSQIAKGILDGNSKGIFTGKIHILPKSQRVASSQLNKNLLLSKKAQAHSQPQLEIFADDVKCSHGSTTGQLSDEEVFYFQARGIPADKARTLLAHGFGLEVALKIDNSIARKKAEDLILSTLKTKFTLGERE